MEPPNELFRSICVSESVKEFYTTPIHRFFRLKAVPGIYEREEIILGRHGLKTPMDLVLKIRESRNHELYENQRWRTLKLIDYLENIGLSGMNLYKVAVSIICIELKAPRRGLSL